MMSSHLALFLLPSLTLVHREKVRCERQRQRQDQDQDGASRRGEGGARARDRPVTGAVTGSHGTGRRPKRQQPERRREKRGKRNSATVRGVNRSKGQTASYRRPAMDGSRRTPLRTRLQAPSYRIHLDHWTAIPYCQASSLARRVGRPRSLYSTGIDSSIHSSLSGS